MANWLMIRSEFTDNGPGTQSFQLALKLKEHNHKVYFLSAGGKMTNIINSNNFTYKILNEISYENRSIRNHFISLFGIYRFIKDMDIDYILAHNALSAFYCKLATYFINKPIFVGQSVRGVEIRQNFQWRNFIYKISRHKLFAVSEFTKKVLISFGVNEERIKVTYNGINREKFPYNINRNMEIRDEIGFSEDSFVLITVGHMNGYKGHDMVIKTVSNLRQMGYDVNAIIIGGGEQFQHCKTLATDLNLDRYIHFTGVNFEIYEFLRSADLFVFPSKDGEMFPNSILESLAVGRTFVASDLSGIPELPKKFKIGKVFKRKDQNQLDLAVKFYLDNNDQRIKEEEDAKNVIDNNFLTQNVLSRIISFI